MLYGFVGIGEESTYGTPVSRTRFYEVVDESLVEEIERVESKAIRSGRYTLHRWAAGVRRVKGDVTIELAPQGLGLLLKHCMGAVATTGTGPYTHTLTPGALNGKSLSIEVGKSFVSGTTTAHVFDGCKITDFELSCGVGEFAQLKVGIWGRQATIGNTPSSPTYPANWSPFTWAQGSVTVGGTSYDIDGFSLKVDNGLVVDRHFLGAQTAKEPLDANLRRITGSFTTPYAADTLLTQLRNATEAALVVTFNAAANAQLTVSANIRVNGKWANLKREGLPELPIEFTAQSATSDANALTLTLVNADSAP
jgi:hypothetical protein